MDPNTTLATLREAYSTWEDTIGNAEGPLIDVGCDMRDAIVALDEWLSKGGFLPTAWAR